MEITHTISHVLKRLNIFTLNTENAQQDTNKLSNAVVDTHTNDECCDIQAIQHGLGLFGWVIM